MALTKDSVVYELKEFMMKMLLNWYTSMVWIVKTTTGCFADLIDTHKAYLFDYIIYMPNLALHGIEGVHDEDGVQLIY